MLAGQAQCSVPAVQVCSNVPRVVFVTRKGSGLVCSQPSAALRPYRVSSLVAVRPYLDKSLGIAKLASCPLPVPWNEAPIVTWPLATSQTCVQGHHDVLGDRHHVRHDTTPLRAQARVPGGVFASVSTAVAVTQRFTWYTASSRASGPPGG
eukprot:scaffold2691_cov417-Prasinococcus_capsulatus_cf.AAC.2